MRNQPISRWSTETVGIAVYDMGELADVDDPPGMSLGVEVASDHTVLIAPGTAATHDEEGYYSYLLPASVTTDKTTIAVTWTWQMMGEDRTFTVEYDIVDPMRYWDQLNEAQRQLVVNVYDDFMDGYDSTEGGPYIWEMPQSHFGYETIARLACTSAISYLNYEKKNAWDPPYEFGKAVRKPFPPNWYGLMEKATRYQLLRHLQRSYLEQPLPQNVTVSRLDRRDYSERWGRIADLEKDELDHQLTVVKRRTMYGVKTRANLVAGGIWPISYLDPARPRWPYVVARF